MTQHDRQPWETALVTAALPAGAVPTAAVWMPVGGRALRNSPDDVVALTEEQVRGRLPAGRHLILSIRGEDLAGEDDDELLRLVESTGGGAVVIGLTYDLPGEVRVYDQQCPECGSTRAHVLGPADEKVAPGLRQTAQLYQCDDCGTAWDG